MGSDVKNMSWDWGACRKGGNTVLVCIIVWSIFYFESSIYKTTDFEHSLISYENYFFVHF